MSLFAVLTILLVPNFSALQNKYYLLLLYNYLDVLNHLKTYRINLNPIIGVSIGICCLDFGLSVLDFGLHLFIQFRHSILSFGYHFTRHIQRIPTVTHGHFFIWSLTVDCSTWKFWFAALVCNNCTMSWQWL